MSIGLNLDLCHLSIDIGKLLPQTRSLVNFNYGVAEDVTPPANIAEKYSRVLSALEIED